MAFMAAALPWIAGGAAVYSGVKQYQAGQDAEKEARSRASQLEEQGNVAVAESQRQAIEETRRAKLMQSRATAVAAAGGGKVSDPTIQNILGDIQGEGEYRALSALYSGQSDQNLATAQAAATRKEGRAAKRAAGLNALTTIIGGAGTFYGKYGDTPKHYSAANNRYAGMGDYVVPSYTAGLA